MRAPRLSLHHRWVRWVRARPALFTLLTGLTLLGLIGVQAYFIEAKVKLEARTFAGRMHARLLDIHHSLEEDAELSEQLIQVFSDPSQASAAQRARILSRVRFKIDSVLQEKGERVPGYEFVFYTPESGRIVLSESASPQPLAAYTGYSERAGYRVRAALGKGQFRFGIHFPFELWFFLRSLGWVLTGTILLTLLLALLLYSWLAAFREQRALAVAKNEFINNLTHELKTPIFASSLIHKLARRHLEAGNYPALDQQLALLEEENQALKSRVEKVLELAALDEGQLEMAFEPVDLQAVVARSLRLYQPLVEAQGGSLHWQPQPQPLLVEADPVHLGNLLNNLLDNALKYSHGPARIGLGSERKGERALLHVQDHGAGMSPAVQVQMYEKFFRAPQGDRHEVKGFGLGLTYVRLIAVAHGGELYCESEPGQGTTFTLSLPLLPEKQEPIHEKRAHFADGR